MLLKRLDAVDSAFVAACAERGVRYANTMPGDDDPESGQGRSWRSTLGADTREAAEARLATLGYEHEWLADGSLRATTPRLPAVRTLADGRRFWVIVYTLTGLKGIARKSQLRMRKRVRELTYRNRGNNLLRFKPFLSRVYGTAVISDLATMPLLPFNQYRFPRS